MDAIHTHTTAHVSVQTSQKIDRKYICYYYSFASQIAQTSSARTPLTQIAKFYETVRQPIHYTNMRWRLQIKTRTKKSVRRFLVIFCFRFNNKYSFWCRHVTTPLGCVDIRGRIQDVMHSSTAYRNVRKYLNIYIYSCSVWWRRAFTISVFDRQRVTFIRLEKYCPRLPKMKITQIRKQCLQETHTHWKIGGKCVRQSEV